MSDAIYSDEPTRVERLTGVTLPSQSGNWAARLEGGSSFNLVLGADARDDAAWFSASGPMDFVFASDYVRGPKFLLYELGQLSNYDLGRYLVGANFSDIAAMGAFPAAFLSVIRYPSSLTDSDFDEIVRGIRDACAAIGVHNVGGDIGTAERIILSGSTVGVAAPGRILTRSGAKPGDRLFIGGETGIAAAAMIYFAGKQENGWSLTPKDEQALLSPWKRPDPQLELGQWLAASGATSCQDTSDGLKSTLEELARASGVGFAVDNDRVPIPEIVRKVANLSSRNPMEIVFGASVDFRLLFTLPARSASCSEVLNAFDSCIEIGTATEAPQVQLLVGRESRSLPGRGWTHQESPI